MAYDHRSHRKGRANFSPSIQNERTASKQKTPPPLDTLAYLRAADSGATLPELEKLSEERRRALEGELRLDIWSDIRDRLED